MRYRLLVLAGAAVLHWTTAAPMKSTHALEAAQATQAGTSQTVDSLLRGVLSSTPAINLAYQGPPGEMVALRDRYEQLRDACTWQTSSAQYLHSFGGPDLATLDSNETVPMNKCHVAVSSDSYLHIARVGPLYSNGGYDWHRISADADADPLDMSRALHDHGAVWITAYDLSTVDANMALQQTPPIHIHHSQLFAQAPYGVWPEGGLAISFVQGDTACHPAAGGAYCQARTFPPGRSTRLELMQPPAYTGTATRLAHPRGCQQHCPAAAHRRASSRLVTPYGRLRDAIQGAVGL